MNYDYDIPASLGLSSDSADDCDISDTLESPTFSCFDFKEKEKENEEIDSISKQQNQSIDIKLFQPLTFNSTSVLNNNEIINNELNFETKQKISIETSKAEEKSLIEYYGLKVIAKKNTN